MTLNWVQLPYGDFTARLVSTRVHRDAERADADQQPDSVEPGRQTLTSSARLRWEYTGGSELFVVYSDGRDTRTAAVSPLLNQAIAIKVTRLIRF